VSCFKRSIIIQYPEMENENREFAAPRLWKRSQLAS
jgi:hypothetical protein